MTDYYVDTATGNDTNAGTVGVPWKSLGYAMAMAGNTDKINITSTKTAPCRTAYRGGDGVVENPVSTAALVGTGSETGCVTVDCPSIYQSWLTPSIAFYNPAKAFIAGSIDVSESSAFDLNGEMNLDFDSWEDSTTPHRWGLTITAPATATQETTEVNTAGGSSLALKRTGGSVAVFKSVYLQGGKDYVFSFFHKATVAAYRPKYALWDKTNSLFWNGAAWQSGYITVDTTHSLTFVEVTITIPIPAKGIRLEIQFLNTQTHATNIDYIDDVTLTPVVNTNRWAADQGDVYYLDSVPASPSISACTTAKWTEQGIMALMFYINAVDLATCRTTPYSKYYDSTNDYIYINTGGTAIADMHVEMTLGGASTAITLNDAAADMSYLHVSGGSNSIVPAAACTISNCVANASFNNMFSDGVAPSVKDCFAYFGEEGFISDNAGSNPVYERCTSFFNVDDGYQSISGGQFTAYSCVAKYNGFENTSDNTGFSCEGAAAGFTLINCTAAHNAGNGIVNSATDATNPRVTLDCISYGHTYDFVDSGGTPGTVTNNLYETSIGTDISGTNTVYDPATEYLFISAADLRLKAGSVAYNQANVNANIKTDVRGRRRTAPYSIGAYEPTSGDPAQIARASRT